MIYNDRWYSNRQTPETPKHSRLSGPSVSKRESLCALLLARMREQLARDSLQIVQIAEMSLPALVESCPVAIRAVSSWASSSSYTKRVSCSRAPAKGAIARRG